MTKDTKLRRTALLSRSYDGIPEMITGRIQGPWVVQAGACDHCPDIRVIIFGGEWSAIKVLPSPATTGGHWSPKR
jgi:hypothetical protein